MDHAEDVVLELRRLGQSSIASPLLSQTQLSLKSFGTLFVLMLPVVCLSFGGKEPMMVEECPDS